MSVFICWWNDVTVTLNQFLLLPLDYYMYIMMDALSNQEIIIKNNKNLFKKFKKIILKEKRIDFF